MEETIWLKIGGMCVETFDGEKIVLGVPAGKIELRSDADAKLLVTALWDAISREIASDPPSAREIYEASRKIG